MTVDAGISDISLRQQPDKLPAGNRQCMERRSTPKNGKGTYLKPRQRSIKLSHVGALQASSAFKWITLMIRKKKSKQAKQSRGRGSGRKREKASPPSPPRSRQEDSQGVPKKMRHPEISNAKIRENKSREEKWQRGKGPVPSERRLQELANGHNLARWPCPPCISHAHEPS